MGKTYVFAIGGTGARVLRSTTMLMASGAPGIDYNTEICPIIIDYDLENGDKARAIEAMHRYTNVRNCMMQGRPADLEGDKAEDTAKSRLGFFCGKISEFVPNYSWHFDVENEKGNKPYKDFIGYQRIDTYSKTTKDLVDSLYDNSTDPVYSELGLNMKVGFQGNPNIGSVVFDQLKNCREFKSFQTHFSPDVDNVVIIGSIFGGTGSSGIPKLVTAIRSQSANRNIRNAHLSVILVLPYFEVAKEGGDIQVKSELFNSKTKAALSYYESSGINNLVNRFYYVGDSMPMVVKPHLGGKNQVNGSHFVEMISGMAVLHTIYHLGLIRKGKLQQDNNGTEYFKFNSAKDIADGIGFEQLTDKATDSFVTPIAHNLINFNFIMRYFHDEIVGKTIEKRWRNVAFYNDFGLKEIKNKTILSDASNPSPMQDICAYIYQFYCKKGKDPEDESMGYYRWMDELHSDKNNKQHRLALFKLDCDDIKDFLVGNPAEKKTRSMGRDITKTILDYEHNFDSGMNNALKDCNYADAKTGLGTMEKEKFPWAFIDCLNYASEDIRGEKSDENLKAFFNQLP